MGEEDKRRYLKAFQLRAVTYVGVPEISWIVNVK